MSLSLFLIFLETMFIQVHITKIITQNRKKKKSLTNSNEVLFHFKYIKQKSI